MVRLLGPGELGLTVSFGKNAAKWIWIFADTTKLLDFFKNLKTFLMLVVTNMMQPSEELFNFS